MLYEINGGLCPVGGTISAARGFAVTAAAAPNKQITVVAITLAVAMFAAGGMIGVLSMSS